MEATADTLLNQVTGILLSKIDKQNLNPDFLQKFVEGLLGRFTYSTSKNIKQKSNTNNQTTSNSKSDSSLIDNLKQVYKDLLKDNSYKTDYKNFLKDVLPKDLINTVETTTSIAAPTEKDPDQEENRKNLIKTAPEKQKVIFDGFSERGWAFFSERLPKILKPLMPKLSADKTQGSGGFGLLGPGIALLLGGLAALVTGLMTDGPFKGILKILSKVGLSGAIKMLEGAAKIFIAGFKQIIMAPINLLDDATKLIGKLFGKEAYKTVLKPLRGLTGIFTKMLGGLTKLLTPFLRRIPVVGTVISWGFAYSRFKSGDVIGGIIDVLSGIATIFPGVGTAIGIGLDVLNAFLDYKTGGATKETSTKKGGAIKGWLETAWNFWKEKILNIPLVKNITEIGSAFSQGDWGLALTKLVRIIPGASWILDWMGMTEEKSAETINTQFNIISDFFSWIKESVIDKITNMVGRVIEWGKEKISNIISNIPGYNLLFGNDSKQASTNVDKTSAREARDKKALQNQLDAATTEEERKKILEDWKSKKQMWAKLNEDLVQNKKENTDPSTAAQAIPLAKGGVVTKPTNAIVGEAGPELVLPLTKSITSDIQNNITPTSNVTPLEQVINTSNASLNNTALDQIVNNTKDTNSTLKNLSDALYGLVKVLDKKMSTNNNTTIINTPQGSKQIPSASQVAENNINAIRNIREKFRQVQFS